MDCSGKEKARHFLRAAWGGLRKHGPVFAGLVVLTLVLWQCRFVRTGPNLLEENACQSLEKWIGGHSIDPSRAKADEDGMILMKRKGEPGFSLSRPMGALADAEYLAVTMDAAWDNVAPHAVMRWLQARVVIAGYDANNRFCAPLDHAVLGASGSKGWHRVQSVVQLPPELVKVVLSLDGYGEEGVLRINHLRVEPVRQRSWFVPVTTILLGAWVWALSRVLLPWIRGRLPTARAFLIACGILTGIWFFVFPQGRTLFPALLVPFFLGPQIESKVVIEEPEAVVVPAQVPKTVQVPEARPLPPGSPQPRLRTIVPPSGPGQRTVVTPPPPPPAPVPPTVIAESPPLKRKGSSLYQWLRELDGKWFVAKYNLTHFTAFFGIGLFVFALAGSPRIWPLPFAVALCAEIIPNNIYQIWDDGDVWDLCANCLGLLTALSLVYALQKWRHRPRIVAPTEKSA